jgi:hypothetical protein
LVWFGRTLYEKEGAEGDMYLEMKPGREMAEVGEGAL